jgi:hypothetical protein
MRFKTKVLKNENICLNQIQQETINIRKRNGSYRLEKKINKTRDFIQTNASLHLGQK